MDFIENEYIYDDIEGLQEMLMEVSTEYYMLHVKKFSIIYNLLLLSASPDGANMHPSVYPSIYLDLCP